jgi:hypothetical protein
MHQRVTFHSVRLQLVCGLLILSNSVCASPRTEPTTGDLRPLIERYTADRETLSRRYDVPFSIPVEVLRAALTHQKLQRDFVSSWKFYSSAPAKP